MSKYILTTEETRKAIYADDDFDLEVLKGYQAVATSFISSKTGHKWELDDEIEPMAKQLAVMYIRQLHFQNTDYNKEHDYSVGIGSLIEALQDIAQGYDKTKEIGTSGLDGWYYD